MIVVCGVRLLSVRSSSPVPPTVRVCVEAPFAARVPVKASVSVAPVGLFVLPLYGNAGTVPILSMSRYLFPVHILLLLWALPFLQKIPRRTVPYVMVAIGIAAAIGAALWLELVKRFVNGQWVA